MRPFVRDSKPHSPNKFSKETDVVRAVTILAASFQSFSRTFDSCRELPSQTTEEYGRMGKT